ncbi:uncharacterized protein TNCV_2562771 [Trichonephila clavipes]|uniref:Uncharacterized protein n=1 Tax=Trichonephila clavipes TaxID=2585209 RepID=A0A8X6UWP3_TRICX|nr:uncharacterized protein TNCV_2562771 [Trichonephila clavipes]
MVRLIGNWVRLEVRDVIRFLWTKNVSATAISRQLVANMCHSFQSGRQVAESHNITGSGWPSSSTKEIHTARIEEMIQNDRRCEISSELGLSYMVACSISFRMCCDILDLEETWLNGLISTKIG